MSQNAIVIVVSPTRETDGRQACSGRGPLWDVRYQGRLLVKRTVQPLCDGARALLDGGIDPLYRLVMRREGRNDDVVRSTIGRAAQPSMRETEAA
jgi:hypothetical protein